MCGEANRHLAEAEVAFLNVHFLFARSAQNELIGGKSCFQPRFSFQKYRTVLEEVLCRDKSFVPVHKQRMVKTYGRVEVKLHLNFLKGLFHRVIRFISLRHVVVNMWAQLNLRAIKMHTLVQNVYLLGVPGGIIYNASLSTVACT
jgi:hypothetical protein